MANKSKMFSFRLSEKDFFKIQNKAEKAKTNMTAYITESALNNQIVVINGLDSFLPELKAIGKNLNQLKTLCNIRKIQYSELDQVKEKLENVFEAILILAER